MKNYSKTEKNDFSTKVKQACVAITGVIVLGGMTYVIVKQQGDIKALKQLAIKNSSDIRILKDVMHGNVIHSMRESYKRKLRYHEGRLMAGIREGVISPKDIEIRKGEVEFFSKQLENLDAAEALLNQ